VTISLDGDRETHDRMRVFRGGSYDSTLPKITEFLESRKGRVPVRATITHHNLDVVGIIRHLFSLGFDNVLMAPVTSTPSEPYSLTHSDIKVLKAGYTELARYFLHIIRNKEKKSIMAFTAIMPKIYRATRRVYGCGGGRNYMMVDPVGALSVCHRCGGEGRLKLGDIYKGIDPEKQKMILHNYVDSREDCRACWARYLCGGGCIANNVVYYSTISKSNQQMCDLYRHKVELTMWLYSETYETEREFIQRYCERYERTYMREPSELEGDVQKRKAKGKRPDG